MWFFGRSPFRSPGRGRLHYDRFDAPTLNSEGKVLYWASISIPAISNDECVGAIELFRGSTLVNTQGSTANGFSCMDGGDVWFRYTAPVVGGVVFSTLASDFVTKLGVYRGTCAQPQGSCPGGPVTLWLVANETVYIQVGGSTLPPPHMERGTCVISVQPQYSLASQYPLDAALFSDREGAITMLLRAEDPVPTDPALFHTGLEHAVFSDAGTVAFTGGYSTLPPPTFQQTRSVSAPVRGGVSVRAWSWWRRRSFRSPGAVDRFMPAPKLSGTGGIAYARNDGASLHYGSAVVDTAAAAPGTPEGVRFDFIDQPMVAGPLAPSRSGRRWRGTGSRRRTTRGSGLTRMGTHRGLWNSLPGPGRRRPR